MSRKLPVGVTAAPFIRSGPAVALELARCADRLGYDSFWVAEVVGAEVPWCAERVRAGGRATIYANVHVGVGDRDATADHARFDLFAYVVVDAYAQSFARAGFGDEVEAVRTAHASGDRAAAVAGVSDRMLDAISIVGDEKLVASAVAAYREAGVDVPVVFPVVPGNGRTEAVESTLRAAGQRQHG